MILVDTSVLIGFLAGESNAQTGKFAEAMDRAIPFGISPFTYQEVLQGVSSERAFSTLKEYLESQTIYYPAQGTESFAAAARLYYLCRKAGYIVRSTLDCLIAQIAIENGLLLLHRDRDFEALRKVAPALKFF